jgi:hypothetical protein
MEIDARRSCLDNQMVIEPPALSHVGDRLAAPATDSPSSEPVEHSVRHHTFNDRLNRTGSEPLGSTGHGATTRFVTREHRLIEQQDTRTCAREPMRRGRPRRTGADDDDVKATGQRLRKPS